MGAVLSHRALDHGAMALRSSDVKIRVRGVRRDFEGLLVAPPGNPGVAKDDFGVGKLASDRTKQQGAAVGIGFPGMHEHHGVRLVGKIPDGLVSVAGYGIFMEVRVKLYEWGAVEMAPPVQLSKALTLRTWVHRDISPKSLRIFLQDRGDLSIPTRAVGVACPRRGDGQNLDIQKIHHFQHFLWGVLAGREIRMDAEVAVTIEDGNR